MSESLQVLTPREARTVSALTEVLLPPSNRFPKGGGELPIAEWVDTHLTTIDRLMRWGYRLGLFVINIVFIFSKLALIYKVKLDNRKRGWDRLSRVQFYPLRMLLRLVTSVIYLVYYSDPEIEAAIGYQRPLPKTKGIIPSGNLITSRDTDQTIKTQVCIIGSGAGGAIVARQLAEQGVDVVVLEEGGYFHVDDFKKTPLEVVRKVYRSAGMYATIGWPTIIVPTGRAVGGTTVINSGTCFRLPESLCERWRNEFGLRALHYKDLLPYFEEIEKNLRVAPVAKGLQGNHSNLIDKGLAALGYKGRPLVRNAPGCDGSGHCCFGCPIDAKQSLHLSYIPQALAAGATIYTGCRAERIVSLGSHGVLVQAKRLSVQADTVVLAGGTLNTPQMIQRNKLLPGNRHVGRHISLHPAANVKALFEEKVEAWKGVPQGYWIDCMKDRGVTFEGAFTPPGFGSLTSGLERTAHHHLMENYDRMAAFGFMLTDHSGGSLFSLPGNESLFLYSIKRNELPRYQEAIAFLVDVYAAAGAKQIYPGLRSLPEVTPEEGGEAVRALKLKRTDLELSAFHPLGSCRMGTDESNSVVDSYGRMHRYSNVYIADGSLFPSSLGVNPQVTIMAFAYRVADTIAAHYG